jgi:HPt (histidine-containing phosphotransfer) domain-containing protein
MNDHLDLENLRSMTDGDADIESELFQVFIETAEECMRVMRMSYMMQESESWRKQSHALKGISLNLGAEPLGMLCHSAQLSSTATPEHKAELMGLIDAEYQEVKAILRATAATEVADQPQQLKV